MSVNKNKYVNLNDGVHSLVEAGLVQVAPITAKPPIRTDYDNDSVYEAALQQHYNSLPEGIALGHGMKLETDRIIFPDTSYMTTASLGGSSNLALANTSFLPNGHTSLSAVSYSNKKKANDNLNYGIKTNGYLPGPNGRNNALPEECNRVAFLQLPINLSTLGGSASGKVYIPAYFNVDETPTETAELQLAKSPNFAFSNSNLLMALFEGNVGIDIGNGNTPNPILNPDQGTVRIKVHPSPPSGTIINLTLAFSNNWADFVDRLETPPLQATVLNESNNWTVIWSYKINNNSTPDTVISGIIDITTYSTNTIYNNLTNKLTVTLFDLEDYGGIDDGGGDSGGGDEDEEEAIEESVTADTTPPIISNMPNNISVSTNAGQNYATVIWIEPTITDNEGSTVTITKSHEPGSNFNLGTTQVTYTAEDSIGNQTSDTFNIIVIDNEDPVISNMPNNISVTANIGENNATVIWIEPTITDNVDVTSVVKSHTSGSTFNVGTTSVTYTVEDANGNQTSNSFNVIVLLPVLSPNTFVVTVSGGKYYIDGQGPAETLTLTRGNTYNFNQINSTNATHPLRLSTTQDGTHGGGSQYTTGFITNGTAGSTLTSSIIVPTNGPNTLYYYCANHSNMGGAIIITPVIPPNDDDDDGPGGGGIHDDIVDNIAHK